MQRINFPFCCCSTPVRDEQSRRAGAPIAGSSPLDPRALTAQQVAKQVEWFTPKSEPSLGPRVSEEGKELDVNVLQEIGLRSVPTPGCGTLMDALAADVSTSTGALLRDLSSHKEFLKHSKFKSDRKLYQRLESDNSVYHRSMALFAHREQRTVVHIPLAGAGQAWVIGPDCAISSRQVEALRPLAESRSQPVTFVTQDGGDRFERLQRIPAPKKSVSFLGIDGDPPTVEGAAAQAEAEAAEV